MKNTDKNNNEIVEETYINDTDTVLEEETVTETNVENNEEQVQGLTELGNILVNYIQNIFNTKHMDSYLSKLTDEQRVYISAFMDGYRATSQNGDFIGLYDSKYIEVFEFPQNLLDILNISVTTYSVPTKNLEFSIVEQKTGE